MKHTLFAAFLTLSFVVALAQEPADKKESPCKTEENASKCLWVHGRLYASNGTPDIRLWHIGTKHVYGIHSNKPNFRETEDEEDPQIPSQIPLCGFGNEIYADFEICPLEPFQQGHMQAACINSAKNIVEERFSDPPDPCREVFQKHAPVVSPRGKAADEHK